MNVDVTPLPGIGVRKDFQLAGGRRIGVVTHRDGRTELILSKADDPDCIAASIPMTVDESATLSSLLGAPQLVAQLQDDHRDMPGLLTRQLHVLEGSRFDGSTLGDTAMRTKTGVSAVAVMRAGQVIASPKPDFVITGGDMLVVVGTADAIEAAARILRG